MEHFTGFNLVFLFLPIYSFSPLCRSSEKIISATFLEKIPLGERIRRILQNIIIIHIGK